MFPHIHIQFLAGHAVLWLVAGIPVSLALALWAYRRTLPPLSKRLGIILTGLRFLALLALLLVFLQPAIRLRTVFTRPEIVGLLWDGSRSMQVFDRGVTRADILRRLYASETLKTFGSQYRLRSFLFSDRLDSIPPQIPNALSFSGAATDIAAALTAFQKQYADRKVGAVIVFSDGRVNQGTNPVRIGKTLGFPVHTVMVGEAAKKPDLILDDVVASTVAYVDNAIPIEAIIRATNLGGRVAEAQLRSDGIIARQQIVLPSGSEEKRVRFTYSPTEPGFQKLEIVIPRIEDEFTDENNAREIYIQVLKRKMSVLLLAGKPHPDIGFFRRTLSRDADVDLTVRTVRQDGGFYEGGLPSQSELQDFDLFVFLDFPSRDVSEPFWTSISRTVLEKEKPVFLIAGKRVDFKRLSLLQSRLPIYPPQRRAEREASIRLTADGSAHPVLQIYESGAENSRAWERLPSVYSGWSAIRPQDGGLVLAETVEPDRRPGPPFIVAFQAGNIKSLSVMGAGLYRWDLMMQGIGEGNTLVTGFIEKSFRWLTLRESTKPVRVATDKRIYRASEPVKIAVQVYDRLMNPVNNARIAGALETSGNRDELRFSPAGSGLYETEIRSFQNGDGRVLVEAFLENQALGRDTTGFTISRFTPEFLDTRADPELLAALAETTGGRSVSPDSLAALLKAMNYPPETVERVHEFEPLHSAWALFVILLLLALEWFLRKRRGLP